jgi:hypothetical protein
LGTTLNGIPNSYFFEYDETWDIAYPLASFSGVLIKPNPD